MTDNIIYKSQQKAARIAGFMFLFILIGSTLYAVLILSKLIAAGDASATAKNITENELLFRIGITFELIMAISGVVLGIALFSKLFKNKTGMTPAEYRN